MITAEELAAAREQIQTEDAVTGVRAAALLAAAERSLYLESKHLDDLRTINELREEQETLLARIRIARRALEGA